LSSVAVRQTERTLIVRSEKPAQRFSRQFHKRLSRFANASHRRSIVFSGPGPVLIKIKNIMKLYWLFSSLPAWRAFAAGTVALALFFAPSAAAMDPVCETAVDGPQTAGLWITGREAMQRTALPPEGTAIDAHILGNLADVTVTRRYRHRGGSPAAAEYVVPTCGALVAPELRVRTAAGETAAEALFPSWPDDSPPVTAGTAAPRRWRLALDDVAPGEEVEIVLRYSAVLASRPSGYRFLLPAALLAPAEDFRFRAEIAAPLAIEQASSPSHAIAAEKTSDGGVIVTASSGDAQEEDFILDYRLSVAGIAASASFERRDAGGSMLAMLAAADVDGVDMPPREYIFVVDVSGSMSGFPLETAKRLLRETLAALKPDDRFNLMLFSGGRSRLAPEAVPAEPHRIDYAVAMIDTLRTSRGVGLLPVLQDIFGQRRADGTARVVVVISDGHIDAPPELFAAVRRNLAGGNLFVLGLGATINREVITSLARAAGTPPFVANDLQRADEASRRLAGMIASPRLTNVRIFPDGNEKEALMLPDLFADRPVTFFSRWRGGAVERFVIEGRAATGTYRRTLSVGSGQKLRKGTSMSDIIEARCESSTGETATGCTADDAGIFTGALPVPDGTFIALARENVAERGATLSPLSPQGQTSPPGEVGDPAPAVQPSGRKGKGAFAGAALLVSIAYLLARHRRRCRVHRMTI